MNQEVVAVMPSNPADDPFPFFRATFTKPHAAGFLIVDYSCVPACVRMVLAYYGDIRSEDASLLFKAIAFRPWFRRP
jgi:hypothetical protein